MKVNMGTADRTIRIVLAVFFAVLFIGKYLTGIAGIIALTFAFVFALTSLVGVCPLYTLLGISTCKRKPVRK